tara:strand:- start:79 stop:258 length:180 start_codon:yes stop_codon:yes gene_type:complete
MEFFNAKKGKTTKVLSKRKSPIKPVKPANKPETKITTFTQYDKRRLSRGRTKNTSSLSL